MEETIIIYTKYYSEAVIEILDKYDLSIQVMCFSSYDKVLHYTRTTPNVRGIIFLEHKPTALAYKAYKAILRMADEIAEASKQPFCVSIISNNDMPRKFLTKIATSHIEILFTKFVMLNTDTLRFEGLATVILNTIGVSNETILLELAEEEQVSFTTKSSGNKLEFLRYCLQVAAAPRNTLEQFVEAESRFPELSKLVYLRNHSDRDTEFINTSENLFKIFVEQCIKRREQDEKSGRVNY